MHDDYYISSSSCVLYQNPPPSSIQTYVPDFLPPRIKTLLVVASLTRPNSVDLLHLCFALLCSVKMVYTITVHLYAKDDPESIRKLRNKLIEASRIYSKDKETVSWLVMQDIKDARQFTIVERYEHESVRDHMRSERPGSGNSPSSLDILTTSPVAEPDLPSEQSILENFRSICVAST